MIRAQNAIESLKAKTPEGMKWSIINKAFFQMSKKMHIRSDKILSIQILKSGVPDGAARQKTRSTG